MSDEKRQPGFAILDKGLLEVWPYLREHHQRLLPLLLRHGADAFPKQAELAKPLRIHRNAVAIALKQLVAVGLLTMRSRYRKGGGRSTNVYSLARLDDVAVVAGIVENLKTMTFDKEGRPNARSYTGHMVDGANARSSTGHMVNEQMPGLTPGSDMPGLVPGSAMPGPTPGSRIDQSVKDQSLKEKRDSGPAALGGLSPAPPLSNVGDQAEPKDDKPAMGFTPALEMAIESEQPYQPPEEWLSDDDDLDPAEWVLVDELPELVVPAAVAEPVAGPKSEPAAKDIPAKAQVAERGKTKRASTDDVGAICATHESMTQYLLFGMEGVTNPAAKHPPGNLNWLVTMKSQEDLGITEWGVSHFMGYYWWRVSYYRNDRGIQQSLPNWGRLAGEFKKLLKQMSKVQVYDHMCAVCQHFDVIKHSLGKAGLTMALGETSLTHGLIADAAKAFQEGREADAKKMIRDYDKAQAGGFR